MKKKQDGKETCQNMVNNLYWKTCERDDKAVIKELHQKRELDSIFGLDETGILDDFFHFLDTQDIWPKIEKLNSSRVKRVMVSITQYVVLYMMKIIYSIKHMNSLEELLFSNQAAMRLVGFNARQVKLGICKRGDFHRKHKEKKGPITPETLANNLVKISMRQMENFFNNCIKTLAKNKTFPKRLRVIIDATDIETKKEFPGAGSVTRKETIRDKTGRYKTVEITVWGFKLFALFVAEVKIPLAIKIVQIQRHDSKFTKALIKIAQQNLAHHGKIVELAVDRGFLDGETLWWLHQTMKIKFFVPAKDGMSVKTDARQIARMGGENVSYKCREKFVNRGTGNQAYQEKIVTEVYGVSELNTYSAYGTAGHKKNRYKKSFTPNSINAIVVTQWENHRYDRDKSKVFLTNMDVIEDPFLTFDAYDERSFIENSLFRQTKQTLNLKYPINKSKEGMHLHLILTMSVFALINAYKLWSDKQYSSIKNGKECGLKRFWKKLKAENRDKVIIFNDQSYAIMDIAECMLLLDVNVKEPGESVITKEGILKRYGIV